jgi:hypothetical protein
VKKLKKIMLLIAATVLLMALSTTVVFAGSTSPPNYGTVDPVGIWPPYMPPLNLLTGVEKVIPSSPAIGQIHIITDPLVRVGDDTDANGWVTFWCQSQIGFQYNIGATGLDPLSKYSVYANGVKAQIVPPGTPGAIDSGEGFYYVVVDPNYHLDLGTLKADANGSGGVKGVAQLQSGCLYILWTVVGDSNGAPVLGSPVDDPNAFVVY